MGTKQQWDTTMSLTTSTCQTLGTDSGWPDLRLARQEASRMSVRREALEGIAGRCGSLFKIALLTNLCQKLE
jgi:hypothetical protein